MSLCERWRTSVHSEDSDSHQIVTAKVRLIPRGQVAWRSKYTHWSVKVIQERQVQNGIMNEKASNAGSGAWVYAQAEEIMSAEHTLVRQDLYSPRLSAVWKHQSCRVTTSYFQAQRVVFL